MNCRHLLTLPLFSIAALLTALAAPAIANPALTGTSNVAPLVKIAHRAASAAVLSSPADDGDYINGIWFKAPGTNAAVSKVILSADGYDIGSLSASNGWQLRYLFSTTGVRHITATALDGAGALVAQQSQTLNVVDFSLQGLHDGSPYGNGRTVTVSASDRVGSVRLFADGYAIGAQNVRNSTGGFDIYPALMTTLGNRKLMLQALDTSGNLIGQQSLTVSVQNLTILDPHADASLLPNATLTLHASASRQIARIDYDADGYALGTTSNAGANFELVTTLTRRGARTLTATGYDAAGAYVQRVSESVTVGAASGTGGGIGGADVEARIKAVVADSRCAGHQFPDQGTAPKSYLTGMALTYAKSYCEVKTAASTAAALLASPLRQDGRDALTRYALDSSDSIQRLRSLYTLGIGEGLRESSGNPTEGYDTSAPSHTAENAESGLFQTSYDSRNYAGVSVDGISYAGARQWLDALMAQYQKNPALCRYTTFLGGQRDRNVPNIGSGLGAQFQAFSKDCPAFATEYAMVIFRLNRNHYGPIVRHEAEYAPSCAAMLQQVENEANCKGQ